MGWDDESEQLTVAATKKRKMRGGPNQPQVAAVLYE